MFSDDTKIRNINFIHRSFTPLVSFSLATILFTLGWIIHPVKKHWNRVITATLPSEIDIKKLKRLQNTWELHHWYWPYHCFGRNPPSIQYRATCSISAFSIFQNSANYATEFLCCFHHFTLYFITIIY